MADDIVSQYYLANALRQGQRPSPRSILAQRMMGNALDTSPTTPLGALARALTGVVSAYTLRQAEEGDRLDQKQALGLLMDRDREQQQAVVDWQNSRPGAQQPAAGATPAPAPVMREALPDIGGPGQGGTRQNPAEPGAFSPVAMRTLVGQESAGDPNARPIDRQTGQPRSSALGQAQFIAPTWLAFAGANPNLFQGLDLNTPAGRNAALARRTDPALTEPAVQWYAGQNAQALQQAGLPVTDASLAAAHALGPAGAIGVLRAAPDTPLSRVLSPAAIQANPQYGRMTAGQFVADYSARYAPRAGGVQVAGPGAPTAPADAPPAAAAAPASAAPASGGLSAADRAWIERGLNDPKPRVQQAARNALQVEQAFRQQDAVRTAAPGSAILDRNGRVIGTVPLQPHLPAGWRIGANGQAEQVPGFTPQTSMVPVQGYDRDGNPTLLFPDGQGGLVQARTPDGVSIAPRTREINTGTEMITVDQGGQVVSRRPIDVAGREAQQEIGRAAGQQAAGAEQAAEVAQRTLGQIDAVLNHPAIGLGTGVTGIVARRVPGTPAYDFSSRVDQLQGQAFLQAFNTLRGGGQITEVEGRKATEAIARLDPRLGEEAFRSALGELREIVQTGLARAQRQRPAAGGAPAAAPAATGERPPLSSFQR